MFYMYYFGTVGRRQGLRLEERCHTCAPSYPLV